jgi:UDP-glucuronate 4-epimerase
VYGPRQRPDLAIHKFVKLIKEGKPIKMYGDGSSARDYTYVSDTVSGIVGALHYILNHTSVYEIVNLGNNQPVNLKDLIANIYEVTEKAPNIEQTQSMPGDVDITYASIDKANVLFSYQPKIQLKEGLKNFLTWYEQQN